MWIAIVAGAAMIVMSLVTDYEGGILARMIPMRMHLAADGLLGAFLVLSPWLFGFADQGVNAWLPFVLIGADDIVSALVTDPEPGETPAGRREARGAA